ncbi:LCP family protein [Nocardioides daeguensis]|uniref:Cell envelope-related transcriptional attenuator domain-containing protein n=1 Tax=Nocardioides daeguensis TaxID=908359 RepID=A0ABP6V451_9ACTN|nr:LCP family protein [Nocardioides daeguensis]MBV6727161.1 LCP family protein [Nocardioides daeguensis]MCR1771175.1 LCP family protein [Nocardioides daeguensis]
MTQDVETRRPDAPGSRARRVPTSRADRRRPRSERRARRGRTGGAGKRVAGGRRKAPQPGKVVFKVILASLMSLGLTTGLGVVLVYNNWNGNIDTQDVSGQLGTDRPTEEDTGPKKPMNILVMGTDTRSGKGNGIDGEAGGGLSDTTILFHLSADRKFAYGISVPRDTAVIRPSCYREDGSEIAAATGYAKWNAAFAVGGPACTIRQFEQATNIRINKYVLVDFNQFRDMVNALDGVEVCIPEDIDDETHNIHLKAGTREIKGNEALTYVRARYRIGDGTDPNRTRRQQAFIGSMINKALTAGMIARPDRLIGFMNAASSSLHTDFKNIAQMADLAVTAKGIGADNIKFITTPWVYSDKVSSGIEWTPEVDKLWQLVRRDKPLTPEFLKDALSAGDKPDGSPTVSDAATQSPSGPASPSDTASQTGTPGTPGTTPSNGVTPPVVPEGLSASGREAAGLCT